MGERQHSWKTGVERFFYPPAWLANGAAIRLAWLPGS